MRVRDLIFFGILAVAACDASSEKCRNCEPPNVCHEGRCLEFCYENAQCAEDYCCVEGLCQKAPPAEGECPRCGRGEPIACTNLPESERHLLGIGACSLADRYCINGKLEPCTGGVPSSEIPDNGIDDDCDGTVDEGSPCPAGAERVCHRGLVGDLATALAKGECQNPVDGLPYGRQRCGGDGAWGPCEGDRLPQRAEAPGMGFAEGRDQCDGKDNDCDGLYDEEPYFDKDGDGYTICGSTFSPAPEDASKNTHLLPGVDPMLEDCNDYYSNTRAVGEFATRPPCQTLRSGTCGTPSGPVWDPIVGADPYGDCPKDAICGPSGLCENALGGACESNANCKNGQCVHGVCCKQAACGLCERCDAPGALGTCTKVTPGEDPYGDCATMTVPCPPGIRYGPIDGRCYDRASAVVAGTCDANGACVAPSDACAQPGGIPAEEPLPQGPCTLPADETSCAGTAPYSPGFQPPGADFFGDCTTIHPCQSSLGGGPYHAGIFDLTNDGLDNPLCYYAAETKAACNGGGGCENKAATCSRAPPGNAVWRQNCYKPTSGCSGLMSPNNTVIINDDPYDDCGVVLVCQVGGTCGLPW